MHASLNLLSILFEGRAAARLRGFGPLVPGGRSAACYREVMTGTVKL
jgi:hypothetical protein